MTIPLTAVIVDDHAIFRAGLRADLDPARVEIVGEAGDVDAAVREVLEREPDVVLLDVHLPGGAGGGGAEVAARVLERRPGTRFLALSVSDAAEDVVAVIRAGARGYITKTASGADVTEAAARVAGGDAVFSPRLAGFVLDAFRGSPPSPSAPAPEAGEPARDEDLDRLSSRERDVMRLVARGYTYREAGAELFISDRTVESHVSSVLRKLQLSNRHELTRWAARRGYA
ncbi:response regulator transcription factor [Micrococcus sp. EYE_162]|uniref:response regulator n=1 Tax=Micrococcus TaxID=1269 RepID=UPI002006295C|nr:MULTISPECIES: response regulator transcription factor [unclassified Micrococcus]MCK6095215.1 response regulator transcription factor [Micrococcus sp. EYE_212]MCK6171162.1 response regulator transcription factor [Micrococcus sp. EYE_162]